MADEKILPYLFTNFILINGHNRVKVRKSERLGGQMEAEVYY